MKYFFRIKTLESVDILKVKLTTQVNLSEQKFINKDDLRLFYCLK